MKIYIDLDGPFAHFERHYAENSPTGKWLKEEEVGAEAFWKVVLDTPDFWLNIPLQVGAAKLFAFLKCLELDPPEDFEPIELEVLSAPSTRDRERATKQKPIWVKSNLDETIPINLVDAKDKQNFAREGDILIDDMPRNCEQWNQKGGTAILWTSAEQTIADLKKILHLE